MKKNIMVIGAAGSLGSCLCNSFVGDGYNVIAVDNDENSVSYLCRIHDIPEKNIYIKDIREFDKLKAIIEYQKIDVVVNCAALKHVMWCEKNMRHAIDVNVLANLEIMNYLSKKNKKFIYISSDKAINPKNVYALTKQFADYVVKYYKFKLVRGVNFLNSNGSVLDMWEKQRINNKPFTLVEEVDCNRYFITLSEMADIVKDAVEDDSAVIEYVPSKVYRIYIHDLFGAYLKMHNISDYDVKEICLPKTEKVTEDLGFSPEIVDLGNVNSIISLLEES